MVEKHLGLSEVVNTFEFMHLDHKESLDNAVELVITLLLLRTKECCLPEETVSLTTFPAPNFCW